MFCPHISLKTTDTFVPGNGRGMTVTRTNILKMELEPYYWVQCERRQQRERGIFPWVQVHIRGPGHHLTSSLQNYAQAMTGLGAIYSMLSSMAFWVCCLAWYMIW